MYAKRLLAALFAATVSIQAFAGPSIDELKKQVADTERAFAATMKARDHAAFTTFLADDAIFFSGKSSQVGKQAVAAGWAKLYEGKDAPFSWEPDQVEVLASGNLASSSGPVYGPDGELISRFNSIWRLEPSGQWKIVFDRGSPVCNQKQ